MRDGRDWGAGQGASGPDLSGDAVYAGLRTALRGLRRARRWTQAELGAALGWSRSKVSRVESGRQPLDLLEFDAWCRACGAEPGEVLARVIGDG